IQIERIAGRDNWRVAVDDDGRQHVAGILVRSDVEGIGVSLAGENSLRRVEVGGNIELAAGGISPSVCAGEVDVAGSSYAATGRQAEIVAGLQEHAVGGRLNRDATVDDEIIAGRSRLAGRER